jgi:hypothetical protein
MYFLCIKVHKTAQLELTFVSKVNLVNKKVNYLLTGRKNQYTIVNKLKGRRMLEEILSKKVCGQK